MTSFRDLPIRRKLILAILLTSFVSLALASSAFIGFEWYSERREMVEEMTALADIIGANSTAAVSFNDASTASETLAALKARSGVEMACIYADLYGNAGGLFAVYQSGKSGDICPSTPDPMGIRFASGHLDLYSPISLNEDKIGTLYLRRNLDDLRERLKLQLEVVALVLLGAFLAAYGLAFVLQRFIAKPVLELADVANRISATRDYNLRGTKQSQDEIGFLTDRFNEMLSEIQTAQETLKQLNERLESGIAERTRANEELRRAMEQLQETQAHLVQTEKLASLGSLVAGVAHEINTPVGVGVTAITHLIDSTQALRDEFSSGTLKRSSLDAFLTVTEESTRIILSNLNRALELVQSFKQVAVDQSSSERREFFVRDYLEEVLLSLGPELKKAGHLVEIKCDQKLRIDSYPGALARILTNLLMNSIAHAYDPGSVGHIVVSARAEGELLVLQYTDDGKGISKEHLMRIFDPFFTTQPGRGGSGLGLHIVYNLVTQSLNGRIQARSEPGSGVQFTIRFPMHAEDNHE